MCNNQKYQFISLQTDIIRRPLIFKTISYVGSICKSLKYQVFKPSVCKKLGLERRIRELGSLYNSY